MHTINCVSVAANDGLRRLKHCQRLQGPAAVRAGRLVVQGQASWLTGSQRWMNQQFSAKRAASRKKGMLCRRAISDTCGTQ